MTARLSVERFSELVGAITPFADRATWAIDTNGWSVTATDPAKVMLLAARLDAGAFEEFMAMQATLGWQVDHVAALLADASGPVEVSLEDHELAIETEELRLEDPIVDAEHVRSPPEEPMVEHPVRLELAASTLSAMVGQVTTVCDLVTVGYHPREDVLEVAGSCERADSRLVVERGAEELESVSGEAQAMTTVASSYLESVVAAVPEDRIVTLGLGDAEPVSFGFGLSPKPDAPDSHYGYATAWVAPRTPEDHR